MPPKKEKKAEPEASQKIYKGVYKNKGLYRARIWDVDKEHYLGHFGEGEKAAGAYDRAAICLRGWTTATREGLNLSQSRYKFQIDVLENQDFGKLISELRASGVQSADLKLK